MKPRFGPYPSLKQIKTAVDSFFGISTQLHTNEPHFVRARHIGWYLARTYTPFSAPRIGRYWGGFHHTVVLYGRKKIARHLPLDQELRRDVMDLSKNLGLYDWPESTGTRPTEFRADLSGEWAI